MAKENYAKNVVIIINDYQLEDYAAGETMATLSFPNQAYSKDFNKAGDVVIGKNANAIACNLVIMIRSGSATDTALKNMMIAQQLSEAGTFTSYSGSWQKIAIENGKEVKKGFNLSALTFDNMGDESKVNNGNGEQLTTYNLSGVFTFA